MNEHVYKCINTRTDSDNILSLGLVSEKIIQEAYHWHDWKNTVFHVGGRIPFLLQHTEYWSFPHAKLLMAQWSWLSGILWLNSASTVKSKLWELVVYIHHEEWVQTQNNELGDFWSSLMLGSPMPWDIFAPQWLPLVEELRVVLGRLTTFALLVAVLRADTSSVARPYLGSPILNLSSCSRRWFRKAHSHVSFFI